MQRQPEDNFDEWRVTFDALTDIISIQDKDFKLRRVNQAYADLFGAKPEDLVGKTCYELVHQTSAPIAGCPHLETFKTGRRSVVRAFEPTLGRHVEVSTSPIFDKDGNVEATVHLIRDITEGVLREQEKREIERKSHLNSRLATVGQMAAGVAHEVNNPLTSVIGYSEMLLAGDLPDAVRSDIEIIHQSAERVSDIVRKLQRFARQNPLDREEVNLNQLIEVIVDLMRHQLQSSGVRLHLELAAELPEIAANGSQLQQVFINIISNAIESMKSAHQQGNLFISTAITIGSVRIAFRDDGPGINADVLGHVFDPFFTTRDVGQGTGLGLSVCHRIIEEHGGSIGVASTEGAGATFTIEIPLSD
jgi:PAS domain S-box-containing protein